MRGVSNKHCLLTFFIFFFYKKQQQQQRKNRNYDVKIIHLKDLVSLMSRLNKKLVEHMAVGREAVKPAV